MRTFKLLLLTIFAAVAMGNMTALAKAPSDIAGNASEHAVLTLFGRAVLRGYADGTFRPGNPINRAELLEILIRAQYPRDIASPDMQCFADVNAKTLQWYTQSACLGKKLGIVRGYADGTFKPSKQVNLAEALTMAALTFRIAVPTPANSQPWYAPVIDIAAARGIVPALLRSPGHVLTRGEMAEIVAGFLADTPMPQHPTLSVCGNGVIEPPEQCDDGNLADSDGCSKICILVPEPIRHATLLVEQQASAVATSAANGVKDIPLLKFTALSGRQDAILTGLTFAPTNSSLLYAQNYTLFADVDGDGQYETIVQRGGNVESDRLSFLSMSGRGTRLTQGRSIAYLVRADLPPGLSSVNVGIRFATSESDYVEAVGARDGSPLTGIETDNACSDSICWIRVHTVASTTVSIEQSGNLFVTADMLPLRSRQLVASTTTDELLRLRMRAENEDVEVTALRFDGSVSTIDSLQLYALRPGERLNTNVHLPFAQASAGQCPAAVAGRLCAQLPSSVLIIKPDADAVIAVVARLKSDQSGGISGQSFALRLSDATDTTRAVEARGRSSSRMLTQNNADATKSGEVFIGTQVPAANVAIVSATNDIGLAGIRLIANGKLESSANVIPTGNNAFAAFRIEAFAHSNTQGGANDVVLKSMTIRVTAQNVRVEQNSFRLSSSANPSLTLQCYAAADTGTFDVICSDIDGSTIQSHIGNGQSVTYVLSANVTNPQVSQGRSVLSAALATLGERGGANSVTWSDELTTFTWVDVPTLSVSSTVYTQ